MNDILILDVEASGLTNESYPIEIGICEPNKDPLSWLLQPLPHWSFWDSYAEEHIHHISRNQLFEKGKNAKSVANQLNSLFHGKILFADSEDMDLFWINRLYSDCGVNRDFDIQFLGTLFNSDQLENLYNYQEEYRIAKELSGEDFNHHRAGDDAKMILWAVKKLQEGQC